MREALHFFVAWFFPWVLLLFLACVLDMRCNVRVDEHHFEGCSETKP